MNIPTLVLSVLVTLWLLPALALVVLYLGEARNVPISARLSRFSDQVLSVFRHLGTVVTLTKRRPLVVIAPMDEQALLRSQEGKILHPCVEPSASNQVPGASPHVVSKEKVHTMRMKGFVGVRTVWRENGKVVAVENWKLGLN